MPKSTMYPCSSMLEMVPVRPKPILRNRGDNLELISVGSSVALNFRVSPKRSVMTIGKYCPISNISDNAGGWKFMF